MATFIANISMESNTYNTLKNGGFKLFGFKAVQVSVQGGVPLVWFETDNYLASTQVQWEENYQAYISTQTNPAQGTVINASAFDDTDLRWLKLQVKAEFLLCGLQQINIW